MDFSISIHIKKFSKFRQKLPILEIWRQKFKISVEDRKRYLVIRNLFNSDNMIKI